MANNRKQLAVNEIVEAYNAELKPAAPISSVLRNGVHFITLHGGIVLLQGADDDFEIVYSANLNANPQLIAIEALFLGTNFRVAIGEQHCQNPATGEVAEGEVAAMDMYIQCRFQEARGLVAEMAEQAAIAKEDGSNIETEKPSIEL